MKVVVTAVRVTVTSIVTATITELQALVVTVAVTLMPVMQTNLQDRADHMLHLTVMADQEVTDRVDQADIRAEVTDQEDQVVIVAVEQAATDQVVLVTDLP
jgi:hypothetical protein